MNNFVKDIRTQQEQRELFVEMILEQFDEWTKSNPPKTNFTEEDLQKIRALYSNNN